MNERHDEQRKWIAGKTGSAAVQSDLLQTLDWLEKQGLKMHRLDLLRAVKSYKRQLATSIPAKKALRKLESQIKEIADTVLQMQQSKSK